MNIIMDNQEGDLFMFKHTKSFKRYAAVLIVSVLFTTTLAACSGQQTEPTEQADPHHPLTKLTYWVDLFP
ncbi:hypothetical protein [Paenibacillus polymyxa]|uniref:hypothetical protein n=2 Tax=Paenibacillus TaxID=44249 RepID=UPI00161249D5|nr:hypothetical protein [Paenibacillus polymyxa]